MEFGNLLLILEVFIIGYYPFLIQKNQTTL